MTWTPLVELARARLAMGDVIGARWFAMAANDGGGDCPFDEAELVAGWNSADAARARVAANRTRPVPGGWQPKPGANHAAKAARDEFDL